jgi:hypothetical protein
MSRLAEIRAVILKSVRRSPYIRGFQLSIRGNTVVDHESLKGGGFRSIWVLCLI